MKKIMILFIILGLTSFHVMAKKKRARVKQERVYKKRQMIDLGQILIDGEIVSPGDFSVTDEKEGALKLLYKRKNYNDKLRINIEYVF